MATLAVQPAEYSWLFAKMQLEAMETLLADAKARLAEHPRDARLALTAIIRARPHVPPTPPPLPPTDGDTCEAAIRDFVDERERIQRHNDYLELLDDQLEREALETASAARKQAKRATARTAEKKALREVAHAHENQPCPKLTAPPVTQPPVSASPPRPVPAPPSPPPTPPVPQSPSPSVAPSLPPRVFASELPPSPPSPPPPPPRTPPLDPFFSQPLARFNPPEHARELHARRGRPPPP